MIAFNYTGAPCDFQGARFDPNAPTLRLSGGKVMITRDLGGDVLGPGEIALLLGLVTPGRVHLILRAVVEALGLTRADVVPI